MTLTFTGGYFSCCRLC